MPKIDWRKLSKVSGIVAAGLGLATFLLVLMFLAGSSSGRIEGESRGSRAQNADTTSLRLTKCSLDARSDRIAQCIEEALKADYENQRNEKDLAAQRDMAYWAGWLLIITALQIPIGIAGFLALMLTIDQGRKSLEHAQKATDRQFRPYILLGLVSIKPQGENWLVTIRFTNVGITPAMDVQVSVYVGYHDFPLPDDLPKSDESLHYPYISPRREAKYMHIIELNKQQLNAIQYMQAAVLIRVQLHYCPVEGGAVEKFDQVRMFTASDLDHGECRIIPAWVYEEPRAGQEEQITPTPLAGDVSHTSEPGVAPAN